MLSTFHEHVSVCAPNSVWNVSNRFEDFTYMCELQLSTFLKRHAM